MAHPDARDATSPPAAPTFRTPFAGRAAFHEALQDALTKAQREVWLADRDFADWPLNGEPFVTALQAFLRQSTANHLKLLLQDDHRLVAAAPRFLQGLKPHAVNAQCRIVPAHAAARFGEACSMMIVDRSLLVRRFHRDQPRGAAAFDPATARPWLDQFETVWDESTPALVSTTLGLG